MLDVHPPHHAANNWRDFFIHIATIVVGLLIAVGLEQTVEAIHHRHQAREARKAIHEELILDDRQMQYNLDVLSSANKDMEKNTALLRDPHGSDAIPTSELKYTWGTLYITSAAWDAAKANGSVDYMPLHERQTYEYQHTVAGYALQYELNYLADTKTALAIASRAPTIGGLTPDDREKLLEATALTQGQINSTNDLLHYVDSSVQKFLQTGTTQEID